MHNNTLSLFNYYSRPRRLISLTPLIDVVFILLLFFMSASSYQKWHRLPLNSEHGGQSQKHRSVNSKIMFIQLNKDSLVIDGMLMNSVAFKHFITKKINASPDLKIVIQPDGNIVLQRMVNIIDQIYTAGINDIAIVEP